MAAHDDSKPAMPDVDANVEARVQDLGRVHRVQRRAADRELLRLSRDQQAESGGDQ